MIRLWRVRDGVELTRPWAGTSGPVSVHLTFAPDGRLARESASGDATSSPLGNVVELAAKCDVSSEHTANQSTASRFRPTGGVPLSGGNDRTVRLWDMTTGGMSSATFRGHANAVIARGLSRPDGRHCVLSGSSQYQATPDRVMRA